MTQESQEEEDWSFELGIWQRLLAALVGVVSGLTGAYAVFVSANQAGTAILLLASVAFLLIGIQGTPLSRFGSGEHQIVWKKFRRKIEEQAVQAHEAGQSELARVLTDYARDPSGYSPHNARILRSIDYEKRVGEALKRVFPNGAVVSSADVRSPFDFAVHCKEGNDVGIIVKHLKEPNSLRDFARRFVGYLPGAGFSKVVVITNLSVPQRVVESFRNEKPSTVDLDIVTWNSEIDDGMVLNAVGG